MNTSFTNSSYFQTKISSGLIPFVSENILTKEYTDNDLELLLKNLKPVTISKNLVLNKHTAAAEEKHLGAYIGRGSAYGNRHQIGYQKHLDETHTREDVIVLDIADRISWLVNSWNENDIDFPKLAKYIIDLRGKSVICFCSPRQCHGDWITSLVNHDQPIEYLNQAMKETYQT